MQCSCCGYIPDHDDITKANYNVKTCDTCGKENVCDLCLYHLTANIEKSCCPSCSPLYDSNGKVMLIGANRKFWLMEEY